MRALLASLCLWMVPLCAAAQATPERDEPAPESAERAAAAAAEAAAPAPGPGEPEPAPRPAPGSEEAPILESFWFWGSIALVVVGITLAVIVDVTTDDPVTTTPAPMGLTLARF